MTKNGSNYDVIIAGGGTAGVSCAWNCAKQGFKTLIIEKNSYLGGSITSSLVTPAMKTSDNAINTDFFKALYKKLFEYDGAITYSDGNNGWLNPELTKIALDSLMKEAGVEVIFEAHISNTIKELEKVLSVYIESIGNYNLVFNNNALSLPIESIYFVDATGDGNFCQKIGAKFLEKKELNNENKIQPMSLRFIMSGVDVKKFADWITEYDKNRDVTTACTVDGRIYLSTAYTWDNNIDWALRPIFKRAISDGVITEEDSNYFQLFSIAGTSDSIGFNAPRLINSNISRNDAYILGRESILRLSQFCKKYLKGFENSHISSIANDMGVRASNQVKGKYIYTYNDLISGKKFNNPVLISNYPVDVHSDKKDSSVLEKINQEYSLPIESLMVEGFDNVFVI